MSEPVEEPTRAEPTQAEIEDDAREDLASRLARIESKIDETISGLLKIGAVVGKMGLALKKYQNENKVEAAREFIVCHTCGGSKTVRRIGRTNKEECPTCKGEGEIEITGEPAE